MLNVIYSIIGGMLLIAGIILCIYWQVRFLVATYRCGLWWFFGCLFVPFVDWAFLLFNFKIARKPFGLTLVGLILAGFGRWMSGV